MDGRRFHLTSPNREMNRLKEIHCNVEERTTTTPAFNCHHKLDNRQNDCCHPISSLRHKVGLAIPTARRRNGFCNSPDSTTTMICKNEGKNNAVGIFTAATVIMMIMQHLHSFAGSQSQSIITVVEAAKSSSTSSSKPSITLDNHLRKIRETDLESIEYDVYPRRTAEEAAVLEWGHSAIISALDASVAMFGPQTSQAALLEVECMPILASPVNGVPIGWKPSSSSEDQDAEINDDKNDQPPIQKLDNADEVHGNIVVMTNNGGLSGVGMAKVAKMSGAAALLVVNIDEERPDDIYRLEVLEGEEADAEAIDIPVVMVSLNSANVLTTATVEPDMDATDIVNHGMPERVRLYAGGDRPFFEDVEPYKPTLYLIHNLLTDAEADGLIAAAANKVDRVQRGVPDTLQLLSDPDSYPNVDNVLLWQGLLHTPPQKAIEDRIEQVTGFPSAHFSDFVIDKLEPGSGAQWLAHYDNTHPYLVPMATITIFLTSSGGPVVYPSSRFPIMIEPVKGLAIVHHNTDENNILEKSTIHALLSTNIGDQPAYIARKYIFTEPMSNARRVALPVLAWPFGGKLPKFVPQIHDVLVQQFGYEDGVSYFDKLLIAIPVFLLIVLAQFIVSWVQKQLASGSDDDEKKPTDTTAPSSSKSSNIAGKGKKGKKD